jgi:hypothetical protein
MRRAMTGALAAMLLPAVVAAQGGSQGPNPAMTDPAAEPRIQWASGGIEPAADDLALQVGDGAMTAPGEVLPMGRTYARDGELEAWWYEQGSQQRLNVLLALDASHWWVDSIWAHDGQGAGSEWIYFEDLAERTRTPLGGSFAGDLRLESTEADREEFRPAGSAVLLLDGLRLSAFMPGTRPAPLTGCDYLVGDRVEVTPAPPPPAGSPSSASDPTGRPASPTSSSTWAWRRRRSGTGPSRPRTARTAPRSREPQGPGAGEVSVRTGAWSDSGPPQPRPARQRSRPCRRAASPERRSLWMADRPDRRPGGRPHERPDRVGHTLCMVVVDAWSAGS